MSSDFDNDIPQRVENALTEDLFSIDKRVASKLEAARYQALDSFDKKNRASSFIDRSGLVPGLIFACSLFVVIGIWLVQQPSEQIGVQIYDGQASLDPIDSEVISPTELELVEELEFYEWLDSNGYAG